MAQALFEDHPIEEYLRESGELPELLLPGGIYEFVKEPEPEDYGRPIENAILRSFINYILKTSSTLCHYVSLDGPSPSQEFAERFRYLIISSSLLSTSLPSTQTAYATPTAPGHYSPVPSPSLASLSTTINTFIPSRTFTFIIFCIIPIFLALGYYAITLIALLMTRFLTTDQASKRDTWPSTLETLENLVLSNNTWENTISESLKLLETEESPASPSSVSSLYTLRQTLFETLHTIQTQCDDVRHLLAAISLPETIVQLSPMYAPPSPSRLEPQFGFSIPNKRPLSLVTSSGLPLSNSLSAEHDYNRSRTWSQPPLTDKRATWSASYTSNFPVNSSKGESMFLTMNGPRTQSPGINYSASAPATPLFDTKDDFPFYADGEEPFGVTALNIRRRKHAPLFSPPTRNSLTGLVGSRYTSLMSSPFQEKSDPRIAIQTTLAARRYTCSHLLALRFPDSSSESQTPTIEHFDSSDEGYWEDVRTIICLLTSVLRNATSKLNDILEQHQSDMANDIHVQSLKSNREDPASSNLSIRLHLNSESSSFAPMPSQFSRFAARIDAISIALEEARCNLRRCVEALTENDGTLTSISEESLHISPSKSEALRAYDGLRQTLGHALRECERGREPLRTLLGEERKSMMDQIANNGSNLLKVVETETERHDEQFSSDDSDKTLYNIDDHLSDVRDEDKDVEDGATGHLLHTASIQYLPPPGIEEVFEAESVPINFHRSRSKLTREERVALVKAQRKEGIKDPANVPYQQSMKLGPGDEVVQELKDVIWKVGEQRRRTSLTQSPLSYVLDRSFQKDMS